MRGPFGTLMRKTEVLFVLARPRVRAQQRPSLDLHPASRMAVLKRRLLARVVVKLKSESLQW